MSSFGIHWSAGLVLLCSVGGLALDGALVFKRFWPERHDGMMAMAVCDASSVQQFGVTGGGGLLPSQFCSARLIRRRVVHMGSSMGRQRQVADMQALAAPPEVSQDGRAAAPGNNAALASSFAA